MGTSAMFLGTGYGINKDQIEGLTVGLGIKGVGNWDGTAKQVYLGILIKPVRPVDLFKH